jgi:hypothetical protein
MRVRRRHVLYVQGYDPRGLAWYRRVFRSEYRKFCTLYRLQGVVQKRDPRPRPNARTWRTVTKGRGFEVETVYQFLQWEDIIRRDFARPTWWKVLRALAVLAKSIVEGSFWRVSKASRRFALFIVYPYAILLAHGLVAALLGFVVASIAGFWVGGQIAWLLGFSVAAVSAVLFIRWTEERTYMLYLFDDIVSHCQYAHRQRPDWEARFDAFAELLIEAAATSSADEIIVVGHSSGSFVAVDVLARALARDPGLGRHGPKIVLLTLGANIPTVGFHPRAGWIRDHLARLAVERSIDWIDYQSRKDVMSFYPFDPVSGHGIDVGDARRNPQVVAVRFRDIVREQRYAAFRWQFFRIHFQFLRANERAAAYDYFMIVCGPFSLPLLAQQPKDVLEAVGADAVVSDAAWRRLNLEAGDAVAATVVDVSAPSISQHIHPASTEPLEAAVSGR